MELSAINKKVGELKYIRSRLEVEIIAIKTDLLALDDQLVMDESYEQLSIY